MKVFRIFSVFFIVVLSIVLSMIYTKNIVYAQSDNIELVKISKVVLYQPNFVMEKRINDVIDFSNYIKNITQYYNNYLLSKNYKNEASAIIVFAIKPNNRSRFWLVDNYSNSNNSELNNLLMNINTPAVNEGPIAAAIYIGNIDELNIELIENTSIYIPDEWREAVKGSSEPIRVPDGFLDIIWPE